MRAAGTGCATGSVTAVGDEDEDGTVAFSGALDGAAGADATGFGAGGVSATGVAGTAGVVLALDSTRDSGADAGAVASCGSAVVAGVGVLAARLPAAVFAR